MIRIFLRIWRAMPLWVHFLAAKIARPTFRAAVAAIIFDEQKQILLFKHTYRKFEWGLPAGGLEHREQPLDAMKREFFEETGMQLQIEKLLTVVSAKEDHNLSVIYLCKIAGGEFIPSHEISEIRYFSITELPSQMLTAEKELIKSIAEGKII